MKKTNGKGLILFSEGVFKIENVPLNHKKIFKELQKLKFRDIKAVDGLETNKVKNSPQITESVRILDHMESGDIIYKEITKHVQVSINNFFGYNVGCKIINTWGTKSPPGSVNNFHTHSNYWLSAVYYPHGLIKDKFRIMFESGKHNAFAPKVSQYNNINMNSVLFETLEGDLLIFPAHLRHMIAPNLTSKNRYSIAFNILPEGNIGEGDSHLVYQFTK